MLLYQWAQLCQADKIEEIRDRNLSCNETSYLKLKNEHELNQKEQPLFSENEDGNNGTANGTGTLSYSYLYELFGTPPDPEDPFLTDAEKEIKCLNYVETKKDYDTLVDQYGWKQWITVLWCFCWSLKLTF